MLVCCNVDWFGFLDCCWTYYLEGGVMFKEVNLTPEQAQRKNAPIKVYKNDEFLVQVFKLDGEPTRLTVNRVKHKNGKWLDGITWDQLMHVKRLVGYADKCAIEIYPPDQDIVNVANMRHLWVVDMPDFAWKKDKVA